MSLLRSSERLKVKFTSAQPIEYNRIAIESNRIELRNDLWSNHRSIRPDLLGSLSREKKEIIESNTPRPLKEDEDELRDLDPFILSIIESNKCSTLYCYLY